MTVPALPRSRAAAAAFLLVSAVAAVIELGALALLKDDADNWPLALGVHLGTSVVIAAGTFIRAGDHDEHRLFQTLAVTLPFLGPVSPVLLLLSYPLYRRFRARATPFETWYRALFPEGEKVLAAQIYQAILRREVPNSDYSPVVSYMDVITTGTVDQRIAVVATVARNFRPVFAPILKAALAADSPEVRVQAATAIAKITDDFVHRVQSLEAAVVRAPHETHRLRALAEAYDEYAYTGILDSAMEQNNRLRALQLWINYCELEPGDTEARVAVGRLLMRLERYSLAAQWLERVFAEGKTSRQAVLWYMEVLYALGRTEALRKLAAETIGQLSEDRTLSAKAVSAAQLWAAGAATSLRHAEAVS